MAGSQQLKQMKRKKSVVPFMVAKAENPKIKVTQIAPANKEDQIRMDMGSENMKSPKNSKSIIDLPDAATHIPVFDSRRGSELSTKRMTLREQMTPKQDHLLKFDNQTPRMDDESLLTSNRLV